MTKRLWTALTALLTSGAVWAQQGSGGTDDWPNLGRYRAENAALASADPRHPRIVFMGDSITQHWREMHPAFFTDERIGRGISGQTTPQMLLRFRQDVIDLHPVAVQILAGTNDIAGNTGPMTPEDTEANIRSMSELARAHGIRVILASVPPADRFPWRPGVAPAARIVALNTWLRRYAGETGSTYADYSSVLDDGHGAMREGLSSDHVHPTSAGYDVMEPVARRAIAEALARPKPASLPATR